MTRGITRQRRHRLKWVAIVLCGGLFLLFLRVLTFVHPAPAMTDGPVYSVTTVLHGLASQPQRWVGRRVLIRGLRYPGCPTLDGRGVYLCQITTDRILPALRRAGAQGPPVTLPDGLLLSVDPPPSVFRWLHSLPLVGQLVQPPAPTRGVDMQSHLFRVVLGPQPCNTVGGLASCPVGHVLQMLQ